MLHKNPIFISSANLHDKLTFVNSDNKYLKNNINNNFSTKNNVDFNKYLYLNLAISTLESKDPYTASHSENVKSYCSQFAKYINLNKEDSETLFFASSLHDIGKISISNKIIFKNAHLSDNEYEIMKNHAIVGYKILMNFPGFEEVANIIKYHHERVDGKGYPYGLTKNEIPFISKIISIADAFDAIISDRPYRKGIPLEMALDEIINNAGTQFDKDIANCFVAMIIKTKI